MWDGVILNPMIRSLAVVKRWSQKFVFGWKSIVGKASVLENGQNWLHLKMIQTEIDADFKII